MDEADKILTKAAKLITTKGLCKGAFARDAKGEEVGWSSRKAKTFCAIGALYRVAKCDERSGQQLPMPAREAWIRLSKVVSSAIIFDWSDKSNAERVAKKMLKARKTVK
jgi:hypothetical protein